MTAKKNKVVFKKDESCNMLSVWINDECWYEGNYWDFDFMDDVPTLLDVLGIENEEENYTYN